MKGSRILIVEDERSFADSLLSGLRENGYEATAAYTGENGFELFCNESFDLLLLDINLEGINGFEICKQIRQRDTSIGIIMLTSLHELSDKVTGYELENIFQPFYGVILQDRSRDLGWAFH